MSDPESVAGPTVTLADNSPQPTIVVTFRGPGTADCQIVASDGIEPAKVYTAAYLVDLWAHEVRASLIEAARQARPHLVVPVPAPNREQRRRGPVA